MKKVIDYLVSPEFITSVIFVAAVVIFWIFFRKLMRRYLRKGTERERIDGKTETAIRLIVNIVKYVLLVFAVIVVLQINGVNVTSLVAGLGIAGAVAGLALQDVLKDVIMGTNIISDKFFKIGDVVRYKEIEGRVVNFGVKTTKIRDIYTDNVITVSNRNISEIVVVSGWLDIDVPTPYEKDPGEMRELMARLAAEIKTLPDVNECRFLGTEAFGESAVTYRLRIFCPPEKKPVVRRPALDLCRDFLWQAGVEIPYRQVDVHLTPSPENAVATQRRD